MKIERKTLKKQNYSHAKRYRGRQFFDGFLLLLNFSRFL